MRERWNRFREKLAGNRSALNFAAFRNAIPLWLKWLALGLAAVFVLWFVPRWQVAQIPRNQAVGANLPNLENEFRKTLAQIVGGAFALVALYFTWRRVVAGDRTVRITEEGHITDRFTKAIEQLGRFDGETPNIEVRLGGIYALERIAFDSPRDHWTIMEVLTAYVRRNAPAVSNPDESPGAKPRTDIQAILTVLGRRRTYREIDRQFLNLSNTDLRGADWQEANLEGTDLTRSQLQGANLSGATMRAAGLSEAQLQGADVSAVFLESADLNGAQLQNTGIKVEQVQDAINWELAHYDSSFGVERIEEPE